jgi:hypothetical protein
MTTVGVVVFIAQAQAASELSCFPARTLIGNNNPAPGNRVIRTYVRHSDAGWLILHTLESSVVINRASQYSIFDTSTSSIPHQWTGTLYSNPGLTMVGEISFGTGRYYYVELIYDKTKNGEIIVKTIAECTPIGNTAPLNVAGAPPMLPRYSPESSDLGGGEPGTTAQPSVGIEPRLSGLSEAVIPMVSNGGTFAVPVTINNQLTLKFVVDSGASDVSIPADVVMTLVRTGTITESDFLGNQTYRMADGSTVPSRRFVIRSLKVGDRVLEDVTAGIAPVAGSLLLGQSFLRAESVQVVSRAGSSAGSYPQALK